MAVDAATRFTLSLSGAAGGCVCWRLLANGRNTGVSGVTSKDKIREDFPQIKADYLAQKAETE